MISQPFTTTAWEERSSSGLRRFSRRENKPHRATAHNERTAVKRIGGTAGEILPTRPRPDDGRTARALAAPRSGIALTVLGRRPAGSISACRSASAGRLQCSDTLFERRVGHEQTLESLAQRAADAERRHLIGQRRGVGAKQTLQRADHVL